MTYNPFDSLVAQLEATQLRKAKINKDKLKDIFKMHDRPTIERWLDELEAEYAEAFAKGEMMTHKTEKTYEDLSRH